MDSALYASFFKAVSGKSCVVYKSVVESSIQEFENWLRKAVEEYGHKAFTFVGAPSSKITYAGPSLAEAGQKYNHILYMITFSALNRTIHRSTTISGCKFGCVAIPERHTIKGNEDLNMVYQTFNLS
jgi:hypothetical protein